MTNCAEEENAVTSREYPRVRTMSVTNISAEGAVANGEIIFAPTEILDHGFIWSKAPPPAFGASERISLGALSGTGKFSAIIERSLAEGQKYYIAAYAINKDYTVYGDVISFMSLGSKAPLLSKITPTVGTWSDTITLVGKNFNAISSSNEVKFADQIATIIKSSPDSLWVIVPTTLIKDKADVSVSFDGNISLLSNAFQLKSPEIDEILPGEATVNSMIEIKGKYFNPLSTKVFISGKAVTTNSITSERITFKVPPGLPSGINQVKVQTGEGALFIIAGIGFEIFNPVITQVIPSSAFLYDTIRIVGKYFGTDPSTIKVQLNDENVQIVSVTETEVKVIIPSYINSTKPTIRMAVNGSVLESSNLFSLKKAEIASVTPLRISSPCEILIKGKYFNPYLLNNVYLNDQQITVVTVGYNEMLVYAQNNFSTNDLTLKMSWFDQETIYPVKLTSPWRIMPNLAPASFGSARVFSYNNKIFAGIDFYAPDPSVFWTYQPTTDQWEEFTRFPEQIAVEPFSFTIGSTLFLGSVNELSPAIPYSLWSLNLSTGVWIKLKDTPFSTDAPPLSFSIGNTGYALLEISPGETGLWKYLEISDQWTLISTLPFSANQSNQHIVRNGEFFLFEGSYLRKFSPVTNQWTDLGNAPVQPVFTTLINDKLYVGSSNRVFSVYDPITNSWQEDLNHVGEARGSGFFISLNGKGYLFGGFSAYGSQSQNVFEFNPSY